MDQNSNLREDNGISLLAILYAVKRNIWLMILVVVLSIGVGVGYIFTVEPNYTSTLKVAYKAENDLDSTTQNNINAMNAFIGTIVDFCDEGVVVDRANFYYNGYLNEKRHEGDDYTVQDYVDAIRIKDTYDQTVPKLQAIVAKNISTSYEVDEEDAAKFSFYVGYTDKDANASADKVKILALAFDLETKETIVIDNKEQGKYFAGITSEIIDLDYVGKPVSDVSKTRVLLLSGIVGVILALLLVYLLVISDKTLKDKEELEEIIGADMLSYIAKQEVRNVRK